MARKKVFDENGEEPQNVKTLVKEGGGGGHCEKPPLYRNNHFLGGGTGVKNEFRHSNAKNLEESIDSAVGRQLFNIGLTIREMPGDGNCLFRALSDQIAGSSRNHLDHRRAVVQYMKEYRGDFEPFVEDDVPCDKYVQRLAQAGTFAGNDAIVAFSRLHNVSVVIHQLNTPAWVIHPSKDSQEPIHGGREVHIFYSNGDHYNSVRRIGDLSESPTNIRLQVQTGASKQEFDASGKKSPPHTACSTVTASSLGYPVQYESKRDEDYWVKDSGDIDRLVEEVMQQTNYPDPNLIRETLIDYNFDMVATVEFIISMTDLMNQHQYQEPFVNGDSTSQNTTNPDNTDSVPIQIPVTIMERSSPKPVKTDQSPVHSPVGSIESDDTSSSSIVDDDKSSQDNVEANVAVANDTENKTPVNNSRKEVKRTTTRQKKELRRREKRRDADRRKVTNTGVSADKENTVVISHLGSLDI